MPPNSASATCVLPIGPVHAARRRTSAPAGLRLTGAGFWFGAVSVVSTVAALNSEANLLLLLALLALAALAVNAVFCLRMVRAVEVERAAPSTAIAGRPFTLVYLLRSRRRWTRVFSVTVEEVDAGRPLAGFPRAHLMVLRPGAEERIEVAGLRRRRGRVALRRVRVSSRFPFGLVSCHVDHILPGAMTIYPAIGRLRRNPWRAQETALQARRATERAAGQEEFHGLREYREGDDPRRIHWKRSARTGQILVREYRPQRDCSLIVIVDPWPETREVAPGRGTLARSVGGWGTGFDPQVERVISAAATAVCDGLERGHRVGLICRGAHSVAIAPSSGRPHRERLLGELAKLSPGGEESVDRLVGRTRWTSGWSARCLICAPRVIDAHERLRRRLAQRAEAVVVVTPQEGRLDLFFDLPT